MNLKEITASIVVLLVAGIVGLTTYDLSNMDAEAIILCASDEGGIRMPGKICEYYLYNHRNVKADVEQIASGAGLAFILNGGSEKKYKIAEFFLSNGLDVNGVNHYGDYNLTPIYGSVLLNDVEMARFLLGQGADLRVRPPSVNMNPLEFGQSLQENDPTVDRRKVLELLAERMKNT
jgi:hypothetical protein